MRILVFQHLVVEHPGVFREFWCEDGHVWDAVELDEGQSIPALEPYDLLVVLGGPMDVWQQDEHPWLVAELAAIRRWVVELERPYLGICLGHQLLGAALGGAVGLMARPEVGIEDVILTAAGRADPLLEGFAPIIQVFQWHGAEVAELPPGAAILAISAACRIQAMRWGQHAYGFQYHVELTAQTVAEWAAIPEYTASLQAALGAEAAAALDGAVAAKLPLFRTAARLLNRNLFRMLARKG